MDISESLGFVLEDEDWLNKVLPGGVIGLIPLVNLATVGYCLRTMKNVAAGHRHPLPAWDRLGDDLVTGAKVTAGCAIYALPLILLGAVTAGVSALGAETGSPDAIRGIVQLCLSGLACLTGVYALLLGLWLPAAVVRYAQSGLFASLFQFGDIWGFIAHNLGGYIVTLLVAWVAGLAALLIGSVFCLVGVAFTALIAGLIHAHLLGQLLREAPAMAPGFQ
jgi:hypothetical protein